MKNESFKEKLVDETVKIITSYTKEKEIEDVLTKKIIEVFTEFLMSKGG
ncbi:MAG: hypothetical protein QXE05_05230 [Nitrososphaeria archaeon]